MLAAFDFGTIVDFSKLVLEQKPRKYCYVQIILICHSFLFLKSGLDLFTILAIHLFLLQVISWAKQKKKSSCMHHKHMTGCLKHEIQFKQNHKHMIGSLKLNVHLKENHFSRMCMSYSIIFPYSFGRIFKFLIFFVCIIIKTRLILKS